MYSLIFIDFCLFCLSCFVTQLAVFSCVHLCAILKNNYTCTPLSDSEIHVWVEPSSQTEFVAKAQTNRTIDSARESIVNYA